MNHDERERYVTRNKILTLLSDDEVARVSMLEAATRLDKGDEYLDLDALYQGVQRCAGSETPMARVLPRRAIRQETWSRILRELAGAQVALPPSGGRTDDSY
jgi:hypothetical protein